LFLTTKQQRNHLFLLPPFFIFIFYLTRVKLPETSTQALPQGKVQFMSIENLKSYDPFADDGGSNQDSKPADNIHIRIQQRNGRKTLTTVTGLPKEYDLKRILKSLKKEFATNGTIVDDEEVGQVVQFQGDQRLKISDFIVKELGIKKERIKIHGF